MKLGFYDSGLGGIAVLKSFVEEYKNSHQYVYFGDSAHAPYGEKTPEQLKSYLLKILDYMQEADVDIVVSACNTSSMYLDQIDLEDYGFEVLSLYQVIKNHFKSNQTTNKIGLLATSATINSKRYLDWNVEIEPIKCPHLVPLIEEGSWDQAYNEWLNYLGALSKEINTVILGCTHYSLLIDKFKDKESKYKYIDPAKLMLEYFDSKFMQDPILGFKNPKPGDPQIEFFFSKDLEINRKKAENLI